MQSYLKGLTYQERFRLECKALKEISSAYRSKIKKHSDKMAEMFEERKLRELRYTTFDIRDALIWVLRNGSIETGKPVKRIMKYLAGGAMLPVLNKALAMEANEVLIRSESEKNWAINELFERYKSDGKRGVDRFYIELIDRYPFDITHLAEISRAWLSLRYLDCLRRAEAPRQKKEPLKTENKAS